MGLDFWEDHSRYDESLRDRYITGVEATITTCLTCKTVSTRMEQTAVYNVPLPTGRSAATLTDLLGARGAARTVEDYRCDKCERKLPATQMTRSARLPEVLIISLGRYGFSAKAVKNNMVVTFDVDSLSLEPAFLPPDQRELSPGQELPADDLGFGQELGYQCYGVVMHVGNSLNQGHYYSYLRDLRGGGDERTWYLCNDARVDRMEGLDVLDACRRDAKSDADPFLLFYRRKR